MGRLGDTIEEAVGEIVVEKISDKLENMFDKLEATLDEKIDEKISDTVDAVDNLERKFDDLESRVDDVPDMRDVKKVAKFLDNHNYEEMCNEVDGNTKLIEELGDRLDKLEAAGTFNEGHKQIIVDVVREELKAQTRPVHPDDAINMVSLLREIRDLLKAK